MASTKDILDHHLKAFDQGDVDAVLSDYAPNIIFSQRGEAFRGRRARSGHCSRR